MGIRSTFAISAVASLCLTLSSVPAVAHEPADPDSELSQVEIIELCSLTRALGKGLDISDSVDGERVESKVLTFKPIPEVVRCPYGKRHFKLQGYTSFAIASDGSAFMLEISNKIFGRANYFIKYNGEWQFVSSEPTWEF